MKTRVRPLASESLGVRSMATFIETPDVKILFDAGAALGFRAGLLPHPSEYEALAHARQEIRDFAAKADIVTISHYHFDHYTAPWNQQDTVWTWSNIDESKTIYGGRVVYAKDYREAINPSQRRRGYIFHKIAERFVGELKISDSASFDIGTTHLQFTPPLAHGEDESPMGYTVGLSVERGNDKVMICSDIQGPISETTLKYILKMNPRLLILGGPPLYLEGYRVSAESISHARSNLRCLVKSIPSIIVDHHLLRSEDGLKMVTMERKIAAEYGNKLQTMAEFSGRENNLLEARRRLLYEEAPPHPEFQKWLKLPRRQREVTLPPL